MKTGRFLSKNRNCKEAIPVIPYAIFSRRQLGDAAYLVTETYGPGLRFTIGVVVGLEQIAVVNSGPGLGCSLRKYIESFAGANKPFQCYCTSGKSEHIGGSWQFDEAFLPSADSRLPQTDWVPRLPPELSAWAASVQPEPFPNRRQELRSGFIAIGRQHISPRPFPGNTEGSFVILNGEGQLCFLGDAIGPDVTELKTLGTDGFTRYAHELRKLTEERDGAFRFVCSRSSDLISREYVLSVAEGCEEIASGHTEGDLPTGDGYLLHVCGMSAVVYDPTKLKER